MGFDVSLVEMILDDSSNCRGLFLSGILALIVDAWPALWCWLGVVFDGEFDPGSGRTLAACLTHASRAVRPFRGYTSGERVSNT